jgi:hypothetical protein
MEHKQTVVLEQYNEQAMKTFLGAMIRILPLPMFKLAYLNEDWKTGYKALELAVSYSPDVVRSYNKSYNLILTQNN